MTNHPTDNSGERGTQPPQGHNPGLRRAEDLEPGQTPPESDAELATPPAPAPSRPPKSKVVMMILVGVVGFLVLLLIIAYFAGALG
ncbi:DUF6480 family protein [Nesterenkonia sphaerica]|uniref:Uncharacterized protein n=1 Tax=Nesterenkonia sphaerica TaxID=1804988 RepID=A0A5R9AFL0_9MICC|nr:DUF6480 family protein [Nesterenkonia sphaerica]TLP77368.1 hypothetical protein FEF27_04120 [Nesterenkonia sphaerica]